MCVSRQAGPCPPDASSMWASSWVTVTTMSCSKVRGYLAQAEDEDDDDDDDGAGTFGSFGIYVAKLTTIQVPSQKAEKQIGV